MTFLRPLICNRIKNLPLQISKATLRQKIKYINMKNKKVDERFNKTL